MTIEENRRILGGEIDNFPVGMRVLAVDDDPTCLMLLDCLLRKCQYQVTKTNQARSALKMLRENRNRFDLIISDVHMPDMDGFKLLELVGLEMDLPVIMLSANGDPKLVMKGITHGACDYLLKPVRIEELRNIWQHVIRKKKYEPKSQNISLTQDKDHQQGSEGGQGSTMAGNMDQNGKVNRKRKDEEEEGEDSGYENEDPSAQKKPRVVWSIELHRKFVAAVNQLGLEKAVPKRILDLMNVEGITRENVASHLQKYRLYLKRISSVASQQANMVAALGGKDSSYIRMGSFDGFGDLRSGYGDLRSLAGLGRQPNAPLSSYPPSGMLGRLNSPSSVNLRSLSSSSLLIQPSHAQNSLSHIQNSLIQTGPAQNSLGHAQTLSNSSNGLSKFQPVVLPANGNSSLFQGIPSSLELDHVQPNKCNNRIGEFNTIDDLRVFTAVSTFPESTVTAGSSNNSLTGGPGNPLFIQGDPHRSSLKVGPSGANFIDHARCNENWQRAFQSSNPLPLIESFNHDQLPLNSTGYNISSTGSHIQSSPIDFSSNTTISVQDLRGECEEGLVGDTVLNMSRTPNQWCRRDTQDNTQSSNNGFGNLNSLVTSNCVVGSVNQSMDRSNGIAPSLVQHREVEKSTMGSKLKSNEDYFLEPTKSQSGFIPPQSYDDLDDLMSAVMKREQDGAMPMDGEFGFDAYTFGSCI